MSTSILLSRGGITPPLDGFTPVYVQTGTDPSAGGGLDLPPGSIASVGAVYYWKVGPGPTEWVTTPFSGGGGGGGITNVTGSNGVTVTTPVAGVKNASNDLVTGTTVAQVNAQASGSATIHVATGIALTSTGASSDISATSGRDVLETAARNLSLTATAGNIPIQAVTGISLTSSGASNDVSLTSGRDVLETAARNLSLTATAGNIAGHAVTGIALTSTGASNDISLTSGRDVLETAARNLSLTATTGSLNLTTAGADDINLTSGLAIVGTAAGLVQFDAGGSAGMTGHDNAALTATTGIASLTATASDVDITAGQDLIVAVTRDETHTVGRTFGVTAAGATGITLTTTHASTGTIGITSAHGNISLTAGGTATILLDTTSGTGDVTLTSGDDVHVTAADQISVIATNLMTLASTGGGLSASFPTGAITVTSGDAIQINVGGGASFEIVHLSGGTFKIFGGIGKAQQSTITLPTGGTVQDAEARAWIGVLQGALQAWGWMEP